MAECASTVALIFGSGTLLEKRAEAQRNHDHLRRALICEPRGHREMYGAVLVQRTEIEEAAIGTFFLTNDGCAMCCTNLIHRHIFDIRPDTVLCVVMRP